MRDMRISQVILGVAYAMDKTEKQFGSSHTQELFIPLGHGCENRVFVDVMLPT